MPIDIGESINSIADSILTAPIVRTVATNPIYTALVLTFVIVLIVMFVFRDADTEESLLVMCMRSGFWVFIMLIGTLFLHNKVLGAEIKGDTNNKNYTDVFKSNYSGVTQDGRLGDSILNEEVVPVRVNEH